MAKANPIRLGIVGLGRAGWGMHVGELEGKESMYQIVAGCDELPGRTKKLADKFGSKSYSNIDDLLKDPNVEMVDIATRSVDHYEHAIKALASGKHVFLEKPITLTYEQAKKVLAASKKAKGQLYIRQNRRYELTFNHIREIIKSGILGKVYEIKLRRQGYSRRDDWQTIKKFGGGQLLNWGPHIIDHGLQFLESPLKNVWGNINLVAAAGDAEDNLKIILTGENGRIVDLEISGGAAIADPVYTVLGTKGALTSDEKDITLRYLDPKVKLSPRKANPATPEGGFGSPDSLTWIDEKIPVAPKGAAGMTLIWDEMFAAVRKGKAFRIKNEEAVEVMKVVSAVKKGTQF